MFTGIITHQGRVRQLGPSPRKVKKIVLHERDLQTVDVCPGTELQLVIQVAQSFPMPAVGDSVACSGVCLTVIHAALQSGTIDMTFEVSQETLRCTHIGDWQPGSMVNLESALLAGQPLGGHLVLGHVDGLGEIVGIEEKGASRMLAISLPDTLRAYVAPKGSIAVEGVSLTTNTVEDGICTINLIPHTLEMTTLSGLWLGDKIHLEIDPLARYAVHALQYLKEV